MDISETVYIPAILLLVAILLKLFVGRDLDWTHFVEAICELPVEVTFLAMSVVVAFTVAQPLTVVLGIEHCLGGIAVAVIVVSIWRLSRKYFDNGRYWLMSFTILINVCIASWGLIQSIKLIEQKETNTPIETIQNIGK